MEKTRMSALKWWISLAVVLCIALPASLAFAQAAGLAAVGAPDPVHGFPKWYMDKNGLQLAPCLDAGAADPCGLIAAGALPNPALPVVFPTNFPNEVFYNRATARIDGIGGVGRADLGIALEGAFGGPTLTVADGIAAEVAFARLRIRVTGGLVPGQSYTFSYPFGRQTLVASAAGTINITTNTGCLAAPPACNFALALANTAIGPFLQWDPLASAPPAGYIGQPAIPHAIIGSPSNVFTISGPNVGGNGVNRVSTNLFNITGKLFVRGSTTTTLTSSLNPSNVGQAVTLTATVAAVAPATGVPTGTVAFKDGALTIGTATVGATGTATLVTSTLTAGSHPLTAVYSGSLDFLTSTSAVVTQTVNGAVAPPPPPPPAAGTDTVTINLAQQVIGTGELRIEGVNGRKPAGGFAATDTVHDGAIVAGACPGALIGTVSVNGADGTWVFRTVTAARPTTICVQSAGGGVASRAVTPK